RSRLEMRREPRRPRARSRTVPCGCTHLHVLLCPAGGRAASGRPGPDESLPGAASRCSYTPLISAPDPLLMRHEPCSCWYAQSASGFLACLWAEGAVVREARQAERTHKVRMQQNHLTPRVASEIGADRR